MKALVGTSFGLVLPTGVALEWRGKIFASKVQRMFKWRLRALLPGHSNLQILLRYKVLQIKPTIKEGWPDNPNWLFLNKFKGS